MEVDAVAVQEPEEISRTSFVLPALRDTFGANEKSL